MNQNISGTLKYIHLICKYILFFISFFSMHFVHMLMAFYHLRLLVQIAPTWLTSSSIKKEKGIEDSIQNMNIVSF